MNYDFQLGEVHIEASSISAERFFGEGELLFAGHFPSNKILPGVMLLEYALYLGGVYLENRHDDRQLSEVLNIVFLAPVVPGMTVRCDCEFVENANGSLTMKAVLVRDNVMCAKMKIAYARR